MADVTITSASIDKVTSNLKAIRDDLEKIAAEREEAGARIGAALDDLATSFRTAYGPVDCG